VLFPKLTGLKQALGSATIVTDWDYEGVAPDSAFPLVGSVWPIGVTPGTVGKSETVDFLCVAALWSDSQNGLLTLLSSFSRGLLQSFGETVQTGPPSLAGVATLATLGNLTIGAPSSSAPSSIGVTSGVWASVRFTISLR
jgi:hypothetical protein